MTLPRADAEPSGVSVIVPIHAGRSSMLPELLSSICRAGGELDEPWETIVVDDSPAPESERVAACCERFGARYLRGPRMVAAKRNLGAASARHDALVFIDSDCLASPGLLHAHLEALRSRGADVAGVVGLTRFTGPRPVLWIAAERFRSWNSCFHWALIHDTVSWGAAANLSVRARTFRTLGGFPEDIGTLVGGEDVAFGMRVTERGLVFATSVEALAYHRREHIVRWRQMLASMFCYGRSDVYLCVRWRDRTAHYWNPAVIAFAGLAAGAVLGWAWRPAAGAVVAALTLGGLAVADLLQQFLEACGLRALLRAQGRDAAMPGGSPGREALGSAGRVLYEWIYSLGAAVEALRRGRPGLAFRRFREGETG